jgi:hypothetical protein
MNIDIIARVVFVSPEVMNNSLSVTPDESDPTATRIKFEIYGPSGIVRAAFDKTFPESYWTPGTMYALVEFWDGYALIAHRLGTYEGIYGAQNFAHKATVLAGANKLLVFSNSPVAAGPNVEFIGGDELFFEKAKTMFPAFTNDIERAREETLIAASVNQQLQIQALESQVDLLTTILATVTAADPTMQSLTTALQDIDRRATGTIAALVKEIKEQKLATRIAEVQANINRLERKRDRFLLGVAPPTTPPEMITPEQAQAQADADTVQVQINNKLNRLTQLEDKRNAL